MRSLHVELPSISGPTAYHRRTYCMMRQHLLHVLRVSVGVCGTSNVGASRSPF